MLRLYTRCTTFSWCFAQVNYPPLYMFVHIYDTMYTTRMLPVANTEIRHRFQYHSRPLHNDTRDTFLHQPLPDRCPLFGYALRNVSLEYEYLVETKKPVRFECADDMCPFSLPYFYNVSNERKFQLHTNIQIIRRVMHLNLVIFIVFLTTRSSHY